MQESDKLLTELKDIRGIMERSSRFLSLSGLSGILIGIYALTGAFLAYQLLYIKFPAAFKAEYGNDIITQLLVIGASVLLLSLITIFFLTIRKAKKENTPIWGPLSKLLLLNLLIPLLTGAILISILIVQEYYNLISSAFLLFYGLALVNAAKFTRTEILGLGIVEIVLGLLAAIYPAYGLYLWAIGFGLVHIIYGVLFLHHDRKEKIL